MWYLLAFEKQGEKLVQTTNLPQMTLDVARRIWGGSDAELLAFR